MSRPDPILGRVAEGVQLRRQGHNAEARALFEQLWADIGADTGAALHRCLIAHSLADAQDDVHDELYWDLCALDAAGAVTDEDVAAVWVSGCAAALFPSLHANLAECFWKIGDHEQARGHLDRARQAIPALPDGDYADMIRSGLKDIAARLEP